jgi:hypothetical protein
MNQKFSMIGVNGLVEKSIPRNLERSNLRASYGYVTDRIATLETAIWRSIGLLGSVEFKRNHWDDRRKG